MPSNYPDGYDVFVDPAAEDKARTTSPTHSQLHKQNASAIEAIQSTLGIRPQGPATTISERMAQLQDIVNELQSSLNAKTAVFDILSSGDAGQLLTSNGPGNYPSYSSEIPDAIQIFESDLSDLESAVDAITDGEGRIRLAETTDAALDSTNHAFQIGPSDGPNLIIDNNEIMARNNGATNTLHLNADGGNVIMQTSITTYSFAISDGRLQGSSVSNYFSPDTGWAVVSSGANNYAYRIGGFLMFLVTVQRTGADITVGSTGDIGNTIVGTLSTACRGNINVNAAVHSCGNGRVATGLYNISTGQLTLAAVGNGSSNIVNGNTIQLGGLVWLGNSDPA